MKIILCMRSAIVTSSLIGYAHTQNDPCIKIQRTILKIGRYEYEAVSLRGFMTLNNSKVMSTKCVAMKDV